MTARPLHWRPILLVGLAVTTGLIVGGVVYFAVRAAFWPSDSTRQASPSDDWQSLRITARYEGANALTIEDTVALPTEVQMVGLERLETIESVSREGSVTTTLYFRPGADLDNAKAQVDKRLSLVQGVLPEIVKMHGIRVTRAGPLPALWLILDSPDQTLGWPELSNLAQTILLPRVVAIPGVSGATAGAGDWRRVARGWVGLYLDSDKLAAVQDLTLAEVKQALALHDEKERPGRELMELVVKRRGNGSLVRLGAVASLPEYSAGLAEFSLWNGHPVAVVAVESDGDSDMLFQAVQNQMQALVGLLPKGTELHLLPGTAIRGTEALLIDARLPEGSSEQRVITVATRVAAALDGLADPKAPRLIPAVLGLASDEPTAFRLYVALCPRNQRAWSSDEVATRAQTVFAEHPDVIFRVNPPWVLNMPPLHRAPVVVGLCGPEDAALAVAEEVRGRLAKSGVLLDLQPEYARPVPQLEIELDGAKLIQLGVQQVDVITTLEAFLGRIRVDRRILGDGIRWIVRASPADKHAVELEKIKFHANRGDVVSLGEVAKIRNLTDIPYLRRIDGKRCMLLTGRPAEGVSQQEARTRCRQIAQETIDQMGLAQAYKVLQQ